MLDSIVYNHLRAGPDKNKNAVIIPLLKVTDKSVAWYVMHRSAGIGTGIIILFFLITVSPRAAAISRPVVFREKLEKVNEILVLPARFDCYHLTSGGIREYNHTMTTRSRDLIMRTVSGNLLKKKFTVSTLGQTSSHERSWRFFRHFYSVVNNEILLHVYGRSSFPDPLGTFDYSLPPIPDSLVYPTTDAVLFIDGFDDRATQKRRRRKTAAAVVSAISVAAILLGGPGVIATVPEDQTFGTCALVNREGEIIWYYRYRKTGTIDMTAGKPVETFFNALLKSLRKGSAD